MAGDIEPFFNRVLSIEGDILEAYTLSWSKMKRTILEAWCVVPNLEGRSTIELSKEIILEVTEAVATAEDDVVRAEWIDQEIGKIL